MKTLIKIQTELKAPKNQFNKFGNYKYRSCEDILEAVKPLCAANEALLTLSDEIIERNGSDYVQATATFIHGDFKHEVTACAKHSTSQKGMSDAQMTGSSSSYARKYALNGLFCIDDTKDDDTRKPEDNKSNTLMSAGKQEKIKTELYKCSNEAEIKAIWESNKELHSDKLFIQLVTNAKKSL